MKLFKKIMHTFSRPTAQLNSSSEIKGEVFTIKEKPLPPVKDNESYIYNIWKPGNVDNFQRSKK